MKSLTMAGLAAVSLASHAENSLLGKLDQGLTYSSPGGLITSGLSGLADFEAYTIDQNAPGLVFGDRDYLISPRLSLFLDTKIGEHFYTLLQTRFDRGFDPGSAPRGEIRFDEYLLRYTPWNDGLLNLQAGKFATVFGSWVLRHDSWNNPFVNAPLPYENVLSITDQSVPPDTRTFLARKSKTDQKATWLPAIWGPSYAAGASAFGSVHQFDYAVEIKNASLSSRPTTWDPVKYGWEDPTVTSRLGWRPDPNWKLGMSASHGGYLLPSAESGLPAGTNREDYQQTTFGMDASYAWRHLQVWSEVIVSRFEVPHVGNADTLGYFFEAKYKIDSRWHAGIRWNQQLFGEVGNGKGGFERWDHDAWRSEFALGCRLSRHWQAKGQYSYSRQNGQLQQGEQMFAGQVTLKF